MAKYLLDSNIISYLQDSESLFYENVNKRLGALGNEDEVMISILTLYEHQYGICCVETDELKQRLKKTGDTILELFSIVPLSKYGANIFGDLKTCYKQKMGAGLKKGSLEKHNVDFIIASNAIASEAILVSNDKIFKKIQRFFSRLLLEDWTMEI